KAMSERVKLFRAKTFIVNSFPPGGAWVFDEAGNILAGVVGDEFLIFDVP
ncbi:MAG: hypothetical protein PWP49_1793, partial [Thermococcaceae archaeon]|nr:hypothetical protein [Thermococcaceae archaeon]